MATETRTPPTAQQRVQRRSAPSSPSPEVVKEFFRLRTVARQNKDEASRQAVIAFAMKHGIGEGAGTIL